MRILDRYILKQFFLSLLFAILAFLFLFLVIDLMENLDDFIDQQVTGSIILSYYIVFIPEIVKLMLPVSVLFASLFTSGKMATNNELTAMKASGISFYRFMVPVLFAGIAISIFSFYFGGYIVPPAVQKKFAIERQYLKKNLLNPENNIYFQESPTRIVNIAYFDIDSYTAIRVSLQNFDSTDITRMVSRMDMQQMEYDTVSLHWIGKGGTYRTFEEVKETSEEFIERELDFLKFKPRDIELRQQRLEEMDLDELERLIADERSAGHDPRRFEIEYLTRFSFAVTSFVVVLFGLPLSANRRKSGLALQFGINILITFIYMGFQQIIQAFGKNGLLEPWITAWIANILFSAAAIVSLIRVRR